MSISKTLRVIAAVSAIAVVAPQAVHAQGGGKNGQATGQATFGNLISALNNISANINQVNALNNLNSVRIVNVSDLLNGNNVNALNNALNKNNVEIARLTNVLNNNTVLTDFLKNNNIAVDLTKVVAVNVLSGGDLILYSQPQTQAAPAAK